MVMYVDQNTGELVDRRWLGAYRPHKRVVMPRSRARDKSGKELDQELPSLARQEFKDECDINVLLKKYRDHGVVPAMRVGEPRYLDCTEVPPDLMTAMNIFIEAEQAFMSLPAEVRKQMDNDPAKFIAFAQDRENLDQLRKWGLAEPEKAPDAPMRVEVVNQPVQAEDAAGDRPAVK